MYTPETISIFENPLLLNLKVSSDVEKNCIDISFLDEKARAERQWCFVKLVNKAECVVLEDVELELTINENWISTQPKDCVVKQEILDLVIEYLFSLSDRIPCHEGLALSFDKSESPITQHFTKLKVRFTFPTCQGLFHKTSTKVTFLT